MNALAALAVVRLPPVTVSVALPESVGVMITPSRSPLLLMLVGTVPEKTLEVIETLPVKLVAVLLLTSWAVTRRRMGTPAVTVEVMGVYRR